MSEFSSPCKEYNRRIMTSDTSKLLSVTEICANVKNMGYGMSQHIRLYGEEFEVVSDPFPEDDGIAVKAKTKKLPDARTVQLPATLLQGIRGRKIAA
ncbi:MAG: hypothetical protein H0X25_14195 [Acidobacteriales bacterium]|nr:hypothetical protein [Terriglobales bacterium]